MLKIEINDRGAETEVRNEGDNSNYLEHLIAIAVAYDNIKRDTNITDKKIKKDIVEVIKQVQNRNEVK